MYNKYFTMKRSELKEVIKAEIKSVLTEEFQIGDMVTIGDGKRKYEVINVEKGFMSNIDDVEVKSTDGMPIGSFNPNVGSKTATYKATQLRLAEEDLNEGKRGVVVDADEIKFHLDQYDAGNIDGDDFVQAMQEILMDMMSSQSVSFSDLTSSPSNRFLREEDEPTDAEIKKADSVASAANKLQKLVKKMKDKAKDFKAAEGKAKEKIKDELKAMTAEKKKLEKSL